LSVSKTNKFGFTFYISTVTRRPGISVTNSIATIFANTTWGLTLNYTPQPPRPHAPIHLQVSTVLILQLTSDSIKRLYSLSVTLDSGFFITLLPAIYYHLQPYCSVFVMCLRLTGRGSICYMALVVRLIVMW